LDPVHPGWEQVPEFGDEPEGDVLAVKFVGQDPQAGTVQYGLSSGHRFFAASDRQEDYED
jgi:hypothetical protein